jgi:glycosyltransferase involved in cell wall biosynthesis
MSGPSIRNWELAHALSTRHNVTLAAPGMPQRTGDAFEVRGYDPSSLGDLVSASEIVQASGYLLDRHPVLRRAKYLVVDLYDPFPLENLHLHESGLLAERHRIAANDCNVLTRLIQAGDLFLCASDRQRDFWTGWLTSVGRVNPFVHRADPGLNRLLRVVPFGISETAPTPGPCRFRGVVPGIGQDDFLVLWGGGIWNWFDPLTLIRAAARLRDRLSQLRVIFPAIASPSSEVLPMAMASEAQRLSDKLGVTGSMVFFGTGWVPYNERGSMLLEADVGASLHRDDVETRYSFRTRVLDYLWAGLPILTTEGDSMADLVRSAELGVVVPYEDVDATAAALVNLAEHRQWLNACAQRSHDAASGFFWGHVAQPLMAYCDNPNRAPDRDEVMPKVEWLESNDQAPAGDLLGRALRTYRDGGLTAVIRKGAQRIKRSASHDRR